MAARLVQGGHAVTAVARGRQLAVLQSRRLTLATPSGKASVSIPVVGHPEAISWGDRDIVILAVKSQDTVAALDALSAVAPASITVVCAQNGVENERVSLRRFSDTLGMCVMCPATFLEPGLVEVAAEYPSAILDVGQYPNGLTDRTVRIARILRAAGFASEPRVDIMRWKYAKLLLNLGGVVEALCGDQPASKELAARLHDEGRRCLDAAKIDYVATQDLQQRSSALRRDGAPFVRAGGSSWQSLVRHTGTIETDYLNGEIVLLGRVFGIPTPANLAMQATARAASAGSSMPGSFDAKALLALASR